jgi:hypothetical protein
MRTFAHGALGQQGSISMPKVIAYVFNAGIHCPNCASKAHASGAFAQAPESLALLPGTDENGIPYALVDGEGNPIHPVFVTDEHPATGVYCDTCGAEIVPRDPDRLICEALEASDPVEAIFQLIKEGAVDEREVGMFIANNPDEEWTHPNDGWCEGFAFISVGDRALATSWNNDGFWDVADMSIEEAREEIAAREAECEDEEEDEE